MAVRTNPALVKEIIEFDTDLSMQPFIVASSNMVDQLVAEADEYYTLSAATLELIERWLAAHFYAMRDQQYSSKSTGGASGSFQGQTAMVLTATQYGQMAMLLDTTNWLSKRSREVLEGRKLMVFEWLGNEPEDIEEYA